jgi:aspartyl-tRNA(Asn)/glutamyl-tRNA(Gln) amidotransferase subunit A
VLRTVAGPDARDRLSLGLPDCDTPALAARVRVVSEVEGEPVDPAVRAALLRIVLKLRTAGVAVEAGEAPYDLALVRSVWGTLSSAGVARVVSSHTNWKNQVSPDIRRVAEAGLPITAAAYVAAMDELAAMRSTMEARFGDADFILTPTAAVLPWPANDPHAAQIDGRPGSPRSASIFATWVNACGLPAISLPLALAPSGVPIGVQLVGRFASDAQLLLTARRLCNLCGPPNRAFLDANTTGSTPRLVEYRV